MGEAPAGSVSALRLALIRYDAHELSAKLTFLTLLFAPVGDWYLSPFILCLSAAGLLVPGLWRSRWLWTVLAVLVTMRFWRDWPLADNHAYLLGYWCIAVAIGAWLRAPRVLALNARLLIGLTFAFAAWQKWTSPDYRNDVFFLTTFLLDNRFEDFVVLFTSITYAEIDVARDYLEGDYRFEPAATFPFAIPESLRILAFLSTIWNLLEQTLVAVTFLAPPASRLGRLRDPALLIFCFTIYAVAPVASFGWLLLAMGIAQSTDSPSIRLGYLAAFVALVFYYEVPWAGLLVDLIE